LTPGKAAQDWEYDIERDIRDRRVDPRAIANITTVRDASAGQVKNQAGWTILPKPMKAAL
jgi:hypothetical protein